MCKKQPGVQFFLVNAETCGQEESTSAASLISTDHFASIMWCRWRTTPPSSASRLHACYNLTLPGVRVPAGVSVNHFGPQIPAVRPASVGLGCSVQSPVCLCLLGGCWLQNNYSLICCSRLLLQSDWSANRATSCTAIWANKLTAAKESSSSEHTEQQWEMILLLSCIHSFILFTSTCEFICLI